MTTDTENTKDQTPLATFPGDDVTASSSLPVATEHSIDRSRWGAIWAMTGVSAMELAWLLLLIGVSGFAGTVLVGSLIGRRLLPLLLAFPIGLALLAMGLVLMGSSLVAVTVLLALWGLFSVSAPVAWWVWVTRATPDDPEAGGALVTAIVQFSIMAGASLGGVVYDAFGPSIEFLSCSALLITAAIVTWISAPDRHETKDV